MKVLNFKSGRVYFLMLPHFLTERGPDNLVHLEFFEAAELRKERLETGQKLSRLAGLSNGSLRKGGTPPPSYQLTESPLPPRKS